MSEDVTSDRSPKAPPIFLEEAISKLKLLHSRIGRAPVSTETAAKAMDYSGLTGSSLTLLAAFSQYGLLGREKGNVVVTPLSLRILHPTSREQLAAAIKEAALAPKVFAELHQGYNDCSESVLSSHLIQNGFNLDRAKRVAKVYTANKEFAKLDSDGTVMELDEDESGDTIPQPRKPTEDREWTPTAPALTLVPTTSESKPLPPGHKMLAEYTIPLGANSAHLEFTGQELVPEDFDALVEYVELFKKQFQRALKAAVPTTGNPPPLQTGHRIMTLEAVPSEPERSFPAQAIWKNKDHDVPVTILHVAGVLNGVKFYQAQSGTGIPENELTFM